MTYLMIQNGGKLILIKNGITAYEYHGNIKYEVYIKAFYS